LASPKSAHTARSVSQSGKLPPHPVPAKSQVTPSAKVQWNVKDVPHIGIVVVVVEVVAVVLVVMVPQTPNIARARPGGGAGLEHIPLQQLMFVTHCLPSGLQPPSARVGRGAQSINAAISVARINLMSSSQRVKRVKSNDRWPPAGGGCSVWLGSLCPAWSRRQRPCALSTCHSLSSLDREQPPARARRAPVAVQPLSPH